MSTPVSLALGLSVLVLGACGGSSSETPFPLEPDLRREVSAGAPGRQVVFSGSDRADAGSSDEPEDLDQERAPATWGQAD
jgi:hypothetical protein